MTAQLVHELELPTLNTIGLERLEALAAIEEARSQHWLARTEMGYSVTRLDDVTAILRDKRFHSALSLLPQMAGLPEDHRGRPPTWQSILSMARRRSRPPATPRCPGLHPGFGQPAATHHARRGHRPDRSGGRRRRVRARGGPSARARSLSRSSVNCSVPRPEDWNLFSGWATDIFRIFNGMVGGGPSPHRPGGGRADATPMSAADDRRAPGRTLGQTSSAIMIAIEEEGDRLSTEEMTMLAEADPHGRDRHHLKPARPRLRRALRRTSRPVAPPGGPTRNWPREPWRSRCAISVPCGPRCASPLRTWCTAT